MGAVSFPLKKPVVDTYTGGPHSTEVFSTTLLTAGGSPVKRRAR